MRDTKKTTIDHWYKVGVALSEKNTYFGYRSNGYHVNSSRGLKGAQSVAFYPVPLPWRPKWRQILKAHQRFAISG